MQVQRRGERARRHRMLDKREAPARLRPVDHEAHADAAEESLLRVRGAYDLGAEGCCLHRSSFWLDSNVARILTEVVASVNIHVTGMSDQKRPYRMRRRAELEVQTRRRITESTIALHEQLGPARTSISAIAERAGVRRSTVYRHFPDDDALFAACSSHWRTATPPPDL